MADVPGWACFDGVILGNRAQTLSYIDTLLRMTDGLNYTVDLDCKCDVLDEEAPDQMGTWTDPVTDNAPWYTDEIPDSEQFLGFYMISNGSVDGISGLDSVPFNRQQRPTMSVGGVLGRLECTLRVVTFTGYMVGRTPEGLDYGKRWLSDILQGCNQGQCGLSELCVFPVCPSATGTAADAYKRTLYRTGLVFGPEYDDTDCFGPNIERVTFQIASELPWLYLDPVDLLTDQMFTFDPLTQDECEQCCTASCCDTNCGKRQSICTTFETAQFGRESTVRIIIEAGNQDATNLHVTVGTNPPNIDQCPGCKQCDEDWIVNLIIPFIPAGARLVIDGATRDIFIADKDNNRISDGWQYVEPLQPYEAVPDIAPCARVCVCVAAHENCIDQDTLKVTVQRIDREL